jgi:hypothetical protein
MRAIRPNSKEKKGINCFSETRCYFALQTSLRKSAHSSQDVPFWNMHLPYSLPSAFFLISVVPLIIPQLTDACLAMAAEVGDTVFITVMVTVGVVKGGGLLGAAGNENTGNNAETKNNKKCSSWLSRYTEKDFVTDV